MPAPMASPTRRPERSVERISSSDMGPTWRATKKPRPKPTRAECTRAVSQTRPRPPPRPAPSGSVRAPPGAASAARGCSRAWPLAHPDEVDHEDERLVRPDHPARAALAVGEVGRDGDAPAPTDAHAGDALVPPRDHLALAEPELEGRAAVPRGVELLPRLPRDADVVHLHHPAGDRLLALADLDVLELELVRRRLVRGDVDLGLLVRGHAPHGSRAVRVPLSPRARAGPRTRCAGSAGTCRPGGRGRATTPPPRAARRSARAWSGCRRRRRSGVARPR